MEDPFLFGRGRTSAANDAVAFVSSALLRFGECASRLHTGYRKWPVVSNSYKVWRAALASEALLFQPAYRMNNPPFAGFVTDDANPCGENAPSYGELKAHPAAAALFPMSGERPRPGRIWAVGKGTAGQLPPERAVALEDAEGILDEADERGIRIYAEGCEGCEGRSWQLAAHLAMDALESGDLGYRIDLAAEWLVTGEVSVCRVGKVGIENKPTLGHSTRRRWLLPEPNIETFRRSAGARGLPELSVTGVRTLSDAIETVRGCVARHRPNAPWPREVACVHAAVGADPSPILRLLELTHPRELHLWPLGTNKEVVAGLRATLSKKIPRLELQMHNNLSADALGAISLALHNHFGPAAWAGDILFDVTAGSWLFRVGVEGVARRMGFPFVCQESDAVPYVKVWYERGVTRFCQMVAAVARPTLSRAPNFGQLRAVPDQEPI